MVKTRSPYWFSHNVEISKKIIEEASHASEEEREELFKKVLEAYLKDHDEDATETPDNKPMRALKIQIHPTKDQKNILIKWIDACRCIYNVCIRDLMNIDKRNETLPDDEKIKVNKFTMRDKYVTAQAEDIPDVGASEVKNSCPKHVREKAAFEAYAAYDLAKRRKFRKNKNYSSREKTMVRAKKELKAIQKKLGKKQKGESNLLEKADRLKDTIEGLEQELEKIPMFIKHDLVLKPRRRKNEWSHIFIPPNGCIVGEDQLWNIFPKITGNKLKISVTNRKAPMPKPESYFQIRWNRKLDVWYILVSEKIEILPRNERFRTMVCDPGIRTPLTCIDFHTQEIVEYGVGWTTSRTKTPHVRSPKSKTRSFKNTIEERLKRQKECRKISLRGLRGYKRYLALKAKRNQHLHRNKIANKVNEFHKKTTRDVLEHTDVFVFPKFHTNQLLRNGQMGPGNDELAKILSHCKLHNYITWKAKCQGKIVIDMNESYTTKTCYNCGFLTDIGAKKTYTCAHCEYKEDRDVNAALNITTKYMGSYALSA